MNIRIIITATITLLAHLPAGAQNVKQELPEDPVQKAIREFNRQNKNTPNEITVVLPPAEKSTAAPTQPADDTPVLVTGTQPAEEHESTAGDKPDIETTDDDSSPNASEQEAPPPSPEGLAVRVEKLQTVEGGIDPSQVKLLAPFPAKPLSDTPVGWHLESSGIAPPFTREVEIANGSKITLTIRPHLLVPDTDGVSTFNIHEPGYDASLGYHQEATVSAVLSKSIRQLENDSKHLGNAIDNLQQILVSLPTPDPLPEPKSPTKRKP